MNDYFNKKQQYTPSGLIQTFTPDLFKPQAVQPKPAPYKPTNNKVVSTPVATQQSAQPIFFGSDALNKYQNDALSSIISDLSKNYGGGVSASRIDINPILDTFRNSANTKATITKDKYSSSRTDLLNAIERFRSQTAEDKARQLEDFNRSRADIEEQAFMAQRGNRASAAARGIGGSGLEALSALQSQIAAGNEVSNIANSNQRVMSALIKKLSEAEQDTTKGITDLTTAEKNELQQIQDELSQSITGTQLAEEQRYNAARQNAASTNASLQAALSDRINKVKDDYKYGANALTSTIDAFKSTIGGSRKKKDIETATKAAKENIRSLFENGMLAEKSYKEAIRVIDLNSNTRLGQI